MSTSVDITEDERRVEFKQIDGSPADNYDKLSGLNVMVLGLRGHGKSKVFRCLAEDCELASGHEYWENVEREDIRNGLLKTVIFRSEDGFRYHITDVTGVPSLEVMLKGMFASNVFVLVVSSTVDFQQKFLELESLALLLNLCVEPKNVIVVVTKMDLTFQENDPIWNNAKFGEICNTMRWMRWNHRDIKWIPTSGITGENITQTNENCPWYEGPSLLNHLNVMARKSYPNVPQGLPCRFSIQTILLTNNVRVVVVTGKLISGTMKLSDFYLSLPDNLLVGIIELKSCGVVVNEAHQGDILELMLMGTGMHIKKGFSLLAGACLPGNIISEITDVCTLATVILVSVEVVNIDLTKTTKLMIQIKDFVTDEFQIEEMFGLGGRGILESYMITEYFDKCFLRIRFDHRVPVEPGWIVVLRREDTLRAIGVVKVIIEAEKP